MQIAVTGLKFFLLTLLVESLQDMVGNFIQDRRNRENSATSESMFYSNFITQNHFQ